MNDSIKLTLNIDKEYISLKCPECAQGFRFETAAFLHKVLEELGYSEIKKIMEGVK